MPSSDPKPTGPYAPLRKRLAGIVAAPSALVPNPETARSWPTYLVDRVHALHASTDKLVRGWPQQ
ncbi:hypothetical protein [Rhodococcus sp. H29-C3]|uniref:hypothetical protein n=1 Tax=Rhodococcus sp. H29-C3 TaxID=3046307 RepID=UPI0024B8D319|nr:hypothetical protein [Rhodococcus sp. H29-C3]MDJ0363303.1 hypothetical protein [Rhodococcus sp. H29-C3]